jgi:hypothetical protein
LRPPTATRRMGNAPPAMGLPASDRWFGTPVALQKAAAVEFPRSTDMRASLSRENPPSEPTMQRLRGSANRTFRKRRKFPVPVLSRVLARRLPTLSAFVNQNEDGGGPCGPPPLSRGFTLSGTSAPRFGKPSRLSR